ncbi:hypothetical protein [Pseudomonas sp. PS02288]|uniref:hypothetical protein n=1 Tax=Pseudomonas sp. PS02288 TaxID=2991443 RepID=UPI00249C70CB|nr:hypothetical protein [Pseudomonas sp. PS02288]
MIDIDKLRKLSPQDGDIFLAPENMAQVTAAELAEALQLSVPGLKAVVLCGNLEQLSEADMNAAGWYRR